MKNTIIVIISLTVLFISIENSVIMLCSCSSKTTKNDVVIDRVANRPGCQRK